ncbi:MAG: hypothetical protein HWD59_14810 [Coxiellaceae bacterium]|nr:MAG: hypothetical protein HWD59_14810 [Coxiellaceae bacterium]
MYKQLIFVACAEKTAPTKEQFFMFNLLNIIIENTKQHNIDKHKDVNYHTLFELDLSGCEVINESMLIDLLEKLPKLRVLTLKSARNLIF